MRRKRHDPPSRAADGFRALDVLVNPDPDRWYVFTNPNDAETGTQAYLQIPGAVLERNTKDGVRLLAGNGVAEGDVITRTGQQLVSYPKEEKLAQVGEVNAKADAFDKRTLKEGNIDDPMRGKHAWGSNRVDRGETDFSEPMGA
jgi:hypothetical protein